MLSGNRLFCKLQGVVQGVASFFAAALVRVEVIHLVDSSPVLAHFYRELVARKGYGRARIALLRKIFSMMSRMLLTGEPFRWVEPKLYEKKLINYAKEIKKGEEQDAA